MSTGKKVWLGNRNWFQFAPAPKAGLTAQHKSYVDVFEKQNAGIAVVRSNRYSKIYNINVDGLTQDLDGISVYGKYATGMYGNLDIHFFDEYAAKTNHFALGWSAPGLVELGWKNIGKETPTYSNVATNTWNLPLRKATWGITTAANATPLTDTTIPFTVIPVPTGYDLYLSINGTSTSSGAGTAAVVMEYWANGAAAATTTVRHTSAGMMQTNDATAPTWGYTRLVSGADSGYYKFFMNRSTTDTITLTLTQMRAVLVPTGTTAPAANVWLPGEGHVGLQFTDSAMVESYDFISPPRKGLSTTLTEVG